DRIPDEIDDHLLNLNLVDEHGGQVATESRAHDDAATFDADECQGARFLHHLVDIFLAPVGFTLFYEATQVANDLAGALSLGARLVHRLDDALRPGNALAFQQPPSGVQVIGDRR